MILTENELMKLRRPTKYEGVFEYHAPEGYEFWSENTKYGSTVWGGAQLTNYYYLKPIEQHEDNPQENIHQ